MRFGATWTHLTSRYRCRAVAGVLVIALPITVLLGVVPARSADDSLTE